MPMKVKKTEQQHVDEGEYKAIISDIQEKTGNWGKYYVWIFIVKGATDDGEELEGKVKVTGLTSDVFSDGSKMCKWAKAAGVDVDEDEIDLDDAKKSIVKIYIEDDENKKDGRIFSKVSKVKKYKKGKKKEVEDDDDDDNDDDDDKPKKKKKSKKDKKKDKKKKKSKPVEDDDDDDNDDDTNDDDTNDDDDEKPKKKKKDKKKGKKKKKEEDDSDDDDNDDDNDDSDDGDEELFDFDDDD
jgi:uncharacterized protein YodC (DUF2158 family)